MDEINEANGTVYILPNSHLDAEGLIPHEFDQGNNDRVGYHGTEPGIAAIVPAGSIVVFSNMTFHRSGENTTDKERRAYLIQYSAEPLMAADGVTQWRFTDPFLQDGKKVEYEG